jgi:hypothetical protein
MHAAALPAGAEHPPDCRFRRNLGIAQVSNLQAALANARAFAGEVVAMLRQSATPSLKAEVA